MFNGRILVCSNDAYPPPSARILTAAGFRVAWSAAGQAQRALRTGPELVLLDLDLTAPETFALLRTLRSRSPVPIVLLTGDCAEADVVQALELGADDCLRKPVRDRELAARLRARLRRTLSDWSRSA